jgi:ATP-dependent DNA helicase
VIISTLQAIIKPFLLRRLKVDVEKDSIPPKKEYVIYAPLTETQREIYDSVVEGGLRAYLLKHQDDEESKAVHIDLDAPMELRSGKGRGGDLEVKERKTFDILDGDDEEYFELLESGKLEEMTKKTVKVVEQTGKEYYKKARS